jgi:hypothetical protein
LESRDKVIRIARQIRKVLPNRVLPTHRQQAFGCLVAVQYDQFVIQQYHRTG